MSSYKGKQRFTLMLSEEEVTLFGFLVQLYIEKGMVILFFISHKDFQGIKFFIRPQN